MSTSSKGLETVRQGASWLVGAAAALLVVGGLACYLVRTSPQPATGAARAAERKQYWVEMQAQNSEALANYAVIKADTGVFRLPVSRAMEVMAAEWKAGGAAGRARLLERFANSQKAASYE